MDCRACRVKWKHIYLATKFADHARTHHPAAAVIDRLVKQPVACTTITCLLICCQWEQHTPTAQALETSNGRLCELMAREQRRQLCSFVA